MKLQKVNASLQQFAPRYEKFFSLPLAIFASLLAAATPFGFWIFGLYFAYWAVLTSFYPPETRLERIKKLALSLVCATVIFLLLKFVFLYVGIPMNLVPLVAIIGFFIALFVCFKIYRSYFRVAPIEIREIPVKSSKPTLFLNQR